MWCVVLGETALLPTASFYFTVSFPLFQLTHREVYGLPAVETVAEPAVVGLWEGHDELPRVLLQAAHRHLCGGRGVEAKTAASFVSYPLQYTKKEKETQK